MLNKTQIAAAIRAVKKEKILSESPAGRGNGSLQLLIRRASSTGEVTATWFAQWKHDGKRSRLRLGDYPAMSRDDAAEAFKRESAPKPKDGIVAAERPTVERLFKAYIESMKTRGRTSWPTVEWALVTGKHNAAKELGKDRAAGAITGGDIAGVLAKIYKRGSRVQADRMRAYLSAAFNWGVKAANDYTSAERMDWGIASSPVATVRRDTAANSARERNLSEAEMALVWHGVEGVGYEMETTAAIRLIMACGQRTRETLRVEGSEVDLDKKLWNMPAEKTKGRKRPHSIPLPHQAVEIFRALKKKHGEGLLFPSCEGAALPHMTDGGLSRALRRLIKDTEVETFQLRDLRRTWKSRAADAGVDRFMRDMIQQHAQGDTGSKHYDRADYLPQMREAMTKWEKWLDANVVKKQQPEPEPEAEPLPMAA